MSLLPRLLLCLLPVVAVAADAIAPPPSPEQVVREFNAALSERRLDAALATLQKGAVNFNLESAHRFTGAAAGAAEPLTVDLATHWKTVAPVLYATHRRYLREVDAATTHLDGPLAVVWTRLRTRAEPLKGGPTLLVISETYQLHLEAGQWRIVSIANSRQTR